MASFLSNEEILRLCVPQQDGEIAFTGERVVPGAVEPQLWNEHVSRYRFACLFAGAKRVLDIGSGTGYGAGMMARSAEFTVGIDSSADAIRYAKARFKRVEYFRASASQLPFQGHCFSLITAFEVIEHLNDWNALLEEASRVLSLDGLLLVSTPNTEYYAEARGASGPNPYHLHEFDFVGFETALKQVFPFVQVLAQNQQETITFSGDWRGNDASAYIPPTNAVADAHFFVAACSRRPLHIPFFADVSSTHNLLREREKHLWGVIDELEDSRKQHAAICELHLIASDNLLRLRTELQQAATLQRDLTAAQQEIETLRNEREALRNSSWIRLGNTLGLGPWSKRR